MSDNPAFDKLIRLLKELFQLDQPDLDFGLYRIMHARSDEITQFLDHDLLPQVKEAFRQYQTADKAELEKELQQAIESAKALGSDPEQTPKVQELRQKIADQSVDISALEQEVYDHLYKFFRRYYHEGDFLAKRVYKPGVYAIPYEGEEVKLHWANKDQYYIKTSEYLRDYAFTLKPGAEDPMRVHFRLVDAAEGEHGNVKESEASNRVFVLARENFLGQVDGESGKELVVRFEYRPATLEDWSEEALANATAAASKKPPTQKHLHHDAVSRVFSVEDEALRPWLEELGKTHIKANGEQADYNRLAAHINRYTARNTFDYFIHKDLGGFLRRELDFYIKNEVMHLDDVESEFAPRVEQYLSKIKVIRQIAGKVIDFLEQLEGFQKKLWLKKKFVTETSYCIRLGCIPKEFYPEIAANESQRQEWVKLHAINELGADLTTVAYSEPLTVEFLEAHPTLTVDTRHFEERIVQQLIEALGDIDEKTDATLFHSENFQSLKFMGRKVNNGVKYIYLDPPYNTSEGTFLYKNNYKHSAWASMISQSLELAKKTLSDKGVMSIAIDDFEQPLLASVCDEHFGINRRLGTLVVEIKPSGRTNDYFFATSHEYLLFYRGGEEAEICFFPLTEDQEGQYSESDEKGSYKWRDFLRTGGYSTPEERPNSYYPIYYREDDETLSLEEFEGSDKILPIDSEGRHRVWRKTPPSFQEHAEAGEINVVRRRDGSWKVQIIDRVKEGTRPKSVWVGKKYDASSHGTKLVKKLFGEASSFSFPKSLYAVIDSISVVAREDETATILDYFAGSGTTGHAIFNLNREDGGTRKSILVEMGDYFDTVLLPRLKKVIFTPEWKAGKPGRLITNQEAKRSPRIMKIIRLESYEDALNNLEVRRTRTQSDLLNIQDAQGADTLRERYLLRYWLDVETRGSQSLLNVDAFSDPTAYKLKVKRPGSEETSTVNVDLLETFNWLIGLSVESIAAPITVSVQFKRDDDPDLPEENPRRLLPDGRIREADDGPWWFRTITGTTPDGRKTLVIWRKLTGDPEQDNLVLDEWFKKQGYSSKDSEFDLIYVNGDNNLENLRHPDDTWKVRLIEEDFHRLMFEEGES